MNSDNGYSQEFNRNLAPILRSMGEKMKAYEMRGDWQGVGHVMAMFNDDEKNLYRLCCMVNNGFDWYGARWDEWDGTMDFKDMGDIPKGAFRKYGLSDEWIEKWMLEKKVKVFLFRIRLESKFPWPLTHSEYFEGSDVDCPVEIRTGWLRPEEEVELWRENPDKMKEINYSCPAFPERYPPRYPEDGSDPHDF